MDRTQEESVADKTNVPKKYWWVIPVGVPIGVALIAATPLLLKSCGGSGGSGGAGTTYNAETMTFNYGTTYVTNVNIIAKEYELQTGRPLSDDLRRQIEAAVTAANQNNHAESARILEQVAKAAPVPAIYHNLGIEYQKTNNTQASLRAFELSDEKKAQLTSKATTASSLPSSALTPPAVSSPAVRSEASAIPSMIVDPISPPYKEPGEIEVVAHGTVIGSSYRVQYKPKPGVIVAMDPGAYDVLLKVASSGAGFVLASNVEVKTGTLTRINPNALVGGIAVESATKKGFPVIKTLQFVKDRLIVQQTEEFGLTLPIAPGSYDMVLTTADNQIVHIADAVAVKAGAITRFDPLGQMAAIVVYKPSVALDMKAIYALNAGTNTPAAKVLAWDLPMLVRAGAAYDVALEQAAGITRIKTVTPEAGQLVEINK
jgi:hypothetical protein